MMRKPFAMLTKDYVNAANAFDRYVIAIGQDRERGGETRAEFFAELDRLRKVRDDAHAEWLEALHDPIWR